MRGRKVAIGRFIITLLMLAIAIIGGTYAWLSYTSKKSALVLTVGDINNSKVIIKPYEISETMVPVNTYTSGVYSQVKAINNNGNKMLLSMFYVINQLDDVLINNGLKYTIVSSTTENGDYTLVKTGDFTTIEDSKQIIFDVKVPSNMTIYYRVYLWLDSSVGDQSLIQNSSLDIELNASVQCDANAPVLDDGMIPVVISNNGIATTISKDNDDWYNYQKQEWANIVLVTSSSRSNYLNTEGIEVSQSDILGYYVWIPRYRYKIWTTAASNTGEEQSIDIIFESKNSPITLGTIVGSYRTHPAFWWDANGDEAVTSDEMLPGIWVGKFETTGSATTPTVLPDMQSLRSQNVSTQFTTSLKFSGGTLTDGIVTYSGNDTYGLTVATNSHMMKNSEWGSVAYLSHSIYGANREIYLNNSSSYYTGRSGGNVPGSTAINTVYTDQSSTDQYNSYGFYTWDGYLLNYDANTKSTTHNISKVASTTGNITGIYDMSGGTREYVMGVLSDSDGNPRSGESTSANSGFNGLLNDGTSYTSGIAFPDKKYYNLYLNSQFTGDYGTNFDFCTLSTCGGHALFETKHWFYDNGSFAVAKQPFFHRGGSFQYGEEGGAFNSSIDIGTYTFYDDYSWRSVLIPVETYEVTYDANAFANVTNKTVNGITISYDGATSYLTLDGTLTKSTTIATFLPKTFVEGEQYKISLTYVSGTFTSIASSLFPFDVHKGGSNLSTRNYKNLQFPTSGTNSTVLTISELAASDGEGIRAWIWQSSSGAVTFDSYVVKVIVTKVENVNICYGDYYRFPENPTRIGYTFTGWYTSESGGTKITSDTMMTTKSNHTLYAHWNLASYTISYDANGGSGAPSSQTKYYGETLTLSNTVPTREGYTFLGWSTSKTATSATYKAGGNYTTNADATLYAVWKLTATVPIFSYTGNYEIVDDDNNVISSPSTWSSDWKIRFLTSGTLTINSLNGAENGIDIFIVGGGGYGATGSTYYGNASRGGGGGGGGAAVKVSGFKVTTTSYSIVIGSGASSLTTDGTASSFDSYSAAAAGSAPGIPFWIGSGYKVPVGCGGLSTAIELDVGPSCTVVETVDCTDCSDGSNKVESRSGGQGNGWLYNNSGPQFISSGTYNHQYMGNYEFFESGNLLYGAGGGSGGMGSTSGSGDDGTIGKTDGNATGAGDGGVGCYWNSRFITGTVGGTAIANTGSGGGGGGGNCGDSSTNSSYTSATAGGAGGSGIVIIRNAR